MARLLWQQIQATLSDHPDVGQAVVLGRGEAGGHDLAAYIVPAQGRSIDVSEMRQYLGRVLADSAVVPGFVVLDELPRTPSGELDCDALPPPAEPGGAVRSRRGAAPDPLLIQGLFEAQAECGPDRAAVVCGDRRLTYAELNGRANQLAHYLKKSGVGPESRVGVCLERTPEVLVALLGIFKAGGVYVPLAPDYPAERLSYMLTDSQVTVLLGNGETVAALADAKAVKINLEDDWARIGLEPADNPARLSRGEDLAYVIYTSGSTGDPKGVMVEHRSLANLLAASRERFGFGPSDVMPCLASFSFDISLFELCNPLCSGGATVIWDQKDVLDVRLLADELGGLTLLHCVPTLMRQLVSWLKENGRVAESLRAVFVGGEAVGTQLLEQMREVFPRAEVHVLYGPTEGTVICASRHVNEALAAPPVGRPIGNLRLYVLDAEMRLAPHDEVGELYLGGAGLTRGYLNRPALTAERFVPDGVGGGPGERLYRTGDLMRMRADGNLEFVGRVDRQVKLRGHRIEPGEVEAALENCPGVSEAVVVIREDQPGQKRLVGYVVTGRGGGRPPAQGAPWFSPATGDYVSDLSPAAARREGEAASHPFRRQLSESVRGKTVLLVGTDREKHLLTACVEGGAERVYVAECNADVYARTRSFVEQGGLGHVVPFLLGDGEAPAIEGRIDVCATDLLGDIGGSKGLEVCLRQLRAALHPETAFYPSGCVTHLSAVELPESLREGPEMQGAPYEDARRIFAAARYPFDLRVRVHGLPGESLISGEAVFERLDCADPGDGAAGAAEHPFQLTVTRDATLCGFALTLRLYGDAGRGGRADCCYAAESPVFVPVFLPGLPVAAGDRIEGKSVKRLSMGDRLHLDYHVEGRVLHGDGRVKPFFYRLPFVQRVFQGSAFYKKLFSAKPIEQLVSGTREQDEREEVRVILNVLKSRLPDYLLPNAIVKMEAFPLTPNGKVDRQALPAPAYGGEAGGRAPVGPREETLCRLFASALGVPQVGMDDSFFELGGDSVTLIQLVRRVRDALGANISIDKFFDAPTVAGLAEHLRGSEGPNS